jgi:hypothetical protein
MSLLHELRPLAVGAVMALGLGGMATEADALTITPDAGWFTDVIGEPGENSFGSPISFTIATSAVFTLLDCCVASDVWTVSGDIAGVSTFDAPVYAVPLGIGDPFLAAVLDPLFGDTAYSRLQLLLGPGTYTFNLTGDGAGGLPAGAGLRVDLSPVPLPAALPLFLAGLLGLGILRQRGRA